MLTISGTNDVTTATIIMTMTEGLLAVDHVQETEGLSYKFKLSQNFVTLILLSRSRSHRRRRSYSRSSSRSRSRRSKSRSKSRQRKRSSRSDSRDKRSTRNSRSRSKSKKLVTTLRDGDTTKPPPSTRRNRSRSGSGWSSDGYRKSGRSRRSWSKNRSPEKPGLEPERLLRSAKEIQIHVQKKLKEQEEAKERKMKELEGNGSDTGELYQRRSTSVDSSKFQSPKKNLQSTTPDLALAP